MNVSKTVLFLRVIYAFALPICVITSIIKIDKLDTNTLRLKEKVERQQSEINNLKEAVGFRATLLEITMKAVKTLQEGEVKRLGVNNASK